MLLLASEALIYEYITLLFLS